MSEALLEVSRAALAGTLRFDRPDDAVTVAQARTRIYRVAAHATRLCRAGLGTVTNDPAAHLTDRENTAARRLQTDLTRSIEATVPILDLQVSPPGEQTFAAQLTRAATAAERAWDLLATQLTPEGNPRPQSSGWVRELGERTILTDAILLARGMANLDTALESAIWAVGVDLECPSELGIQLQQTAADCQSVSRRDLASYSADILIHPTWPSSAYPPAQPHSIPAGLLSHPIEVVTALDGYLDWLQRHLGELTISDLANVVATGARLATLTIAGGDSAESPTNVSTRAWRNVHHAIGQLRTAHPRPPGHQQADPLIEWADRQLAAGIRAETPIPGWPTSARWIASQLTALADAGQVSLQHLHTKGLILGPDAARGHYLNGPADDDTVTPALTAFAAARKASSQHPSDLTAADTAYLSQLAHPTPFDPAASPRPRANPPPAPPGAAPGRGR